MSEVNPLDIPEELISRYDANEPHDGPASCALPLNGIGAREYTKALHAFGGAAEAPLSLYVHLPFCPVRCLNCDHNTRVTHDPLEIDRYLDSLEKEMDLVTAELGTGRRLTQLHLGGGTPNYLTETQLVRLMSLLERHFTIDEGTDASLEANPQRASSTQLDLLRGLGFYRINFGVRDLDPDVQRAIGRVHSYEMIRDVFWTARDLGFETIGMDLTYGLPSQTMASMERTIDRIVDLAPDRIACSAYVRRPEQLPHQIAIDPKSTPSLADKLAIFNLIVQGLTSARYNWIGLDCFAKDDDELSRAQAQHCLKRNGIGYTPNHCPNLIGLGTNAVSELEGVCVQNEVVVEPWQSALAQGRLPISGGVLLSKEDRERRDAMLELMCNMELKDCGALLDAREKDSSWKEYARDGLLDLSSDSISVTPQGRYFLRQICMQQATLHGWGSIRWRYPQAI